MRTRTIPGMAACLALALALGGCTTESSGPALDKAGVDTGPVTLTAWSPENEDRPSGMQLTAFTKAVERLSGRAMVVQARYGNDQSGADPDQTVIRATAAGDVDLALVASRAFSTEGVTSLRALTAPFLIQTDALAAAVARDATVAGPMLDGLAPAGLTGLALFPETIRHPFSTSGPVLGPEDYRGAVLRSLRSEETYAVFRALGAQPGFWDGEENAAKVAEGSIDIVESSFGIAMSVMSMPAVGTGNMAFFPRMNVLFGNAEALDALTASQRDVLDRAAAEAREEAITSVPKDQSAAAAYCAAGGTVVLAGPEQVAALQAEVAPYLAELAQDPTTGQALEAVRALGERTAEEEPVRACQPAAPVGREIEPWPITGGPSPIDGRYRVEITDDDLAAAGVPEEAWLQNHGTYTWQIKDGRMSHDQVAANEVREPHGEFNLPVRGDQAMLISLPPGGGDPTARQVIWVATWSLDPAGTLRFTDMRPGLGAGLPRDVIIFSKACTPLR